MASTLPPVVSDEKQARRNLLALVYYNEKVVEISDPSITLGDVCEALGIPLEEAGVGVRERETGRIVATLPYDEIVSHPRRKVNASPNHPLLNDASMEDKDKEEMKEKRSGPQKLLANKKKKRNSSLSSSFSFFPLRKVRKAEGDDDSSSIPKEGEHKEEWKGDSFAKGEGEDDEDEEDEEQEQDEEESGDNRVETYDLFRAFETEAHRGEKREISPFASLKEEEEEGIPFSSSDTMTLSALPSSPSSSLPEMSALLRQLVHMGVSDLFVPSISPRENPRVEQYQPQQPPYFLSHTIYPASTYSPHRPALVSSFATVEDAQRYSVVAHDGPPRGEKGTASDTENKDPRSQWGCDEWNISCGYRSGVETYSIPPAPCLEE